MVSESWKETEKRIRQRDVIYQRLKKAGVMK
jgi:hypothetical protein